MVVLKIILIIYYSASKQYKTEPRQHISAVWLLTRPVYIETEIYPNINDLDPVFRPSSGSAVYVRYCITFLSSYCLISCIFNCRFLISPCLVYMYVSMVEIRNVFSVLCKSQILGDFNIIKSSFNVTFINNIY